MRDGFRLPYVSAVLGLEQGHRFVLSKVLTTSSRSNRLGFLALIGGVMTRGALDFVRMDFKHVLGNLNDISLLAIRLVKNVHY